MYTYGGITTGSRHAFPQPARGPQREELSTTTLAGRLLNNPVAGHLLPAGSVFSFLAEHRFELFPPGMFADLFPSTRGRPSVAPEIVASVLVLRALNGLSDRVAAVVPEARTR
jgi:hypothetical protein